MNADGREVGELVAEKPIGQVRARDDRDVGKRLAESLARGVDRRKFLRIAADAAFIGVAWFALDWKNVPIALASHTACNATKLGVYSCSPPCGRNCAPSNCNGELCANGCSPSDCGGYSDLSHFCWCTDVGCSPNGYYICCDCCCPQVGSCTGTCSEKIGCCLCSRFVSTAGCL